MINFWKNVLCPLGLKLGNFHKVLFTGMKQQSVLL